MVAVASQFSDAQLRAALDRLGYGHVAADMGALGRALKALHEQSVLGWRPVPNCDQVRFWDNLRRSIRTMPDGSARMDGSAHVILGGNRSGKTDTGAAGFAWMALVGLAEEARRRKKRRRSTTLWAVAETRELCGEILWKEKLQHLIPDREIASISWENKAKEWPSSVRLRNGVEILFKSAEQGRTRFQAKSIWCIWIDEQVAQDILTECMARCIDEMAVLIMSFTPLIPDPIMERRYAEPPKGWTFYKVDVEDNRVSRGGHLRDEAVDKWLAELKESDPDMYETRKSGLFAVMQGAVFKGWRRDIHVVSEAAMVEIINAKRDELRFYAGCDFGSNNPSALVYGARSGDGPTWYVFDEVWSPAGVPVERQISAHAGVLQAWDLRKASRLSGLFADTGDGVSTTAGDEYKRSGRAAFAGAGHDVTNARKEWRASVDTIRRLLARTVTADARGRMSYGAPRLYVSERCVNLIREMPMYRYDPTGAKPGQRDAKDWGALKFDDHAVDALRYLLFSVEQAYWVASGRPGTVSLDEHFTRHYPMGA